MSRHIRALWPAAVIVAGLALLILYAFGALIADADRLPGIDGPVHYAWEAFTRAAFDAGHWPHWNPYAWAGAPHFADSSTGVLYPPAVLLRWLPAPQFFQWMVLLHLLLGGAGTLYLARVIGLGWWSAAAASLAVTLGGAAGSWVHLGHLTVLFTAPWLPWALALAMQSVRKATWLPHPGLPLVLVTMFLAGHIQFALYVVSAVSLYYLYSAVWSESGGPGNRSKALAQLAVLGVLAGGLSAFLLLPMRQLIGEAARSQGLPYETAAAGGWAFRDLATIFWPFAGIEQQPVFRFMSHRVAYVGWLLACVAPFAFTDPRRRRMALFFALLAVAAIVLALGANTPLFRWHHLLFPGLRVPGRFLFLATLSLAVLGAIGFERFVALAAERRWRLLAVVCGAVSVAIGVAALIVWRNAASNVAPPVHLWPWLPALALAGLVLVALFSARRRTWMALATGLLVVAVDLAAFPAGAVRTVPIERTETLRAWLGNAVPGRVWSLCPNRIGSSETVLVGRSSLRGHISLDLVAYAEWFELLGRADRPGDTVGPQRVRRDLIDFANVSTIVSCEPVDAPGLSLAAHVDPVLAYQNERAWPRAIWTCDAVELPRAVIAQELDIGRFTGVGSLARQPWVSIRWAPHVSDESRVALEAKYGLTGGVPRERPTWRYVLSDMSDANLRALVGDAAVEDTHGVHRQNGRLMPDAPIRMPAGTADALELLVGVSPCEARANVHLVSADQPDGRVVADVDASADGLLFLSEPYYRERRAFVDGEPVMARRANLAFVAVPVPSGRHRVELRMVPTTFYMGLGVSAVTLVGWGAAIYGSRRRRRGMR